MINWNTYTEWRDICITIKFFNAIKIVIGWKIDIGEKNIIIKSCYEKNIKYITLIICDARISLWNVNVDLAPQDLPDSKLMTIRRLLRRRKVKDGESEQFFFTRSVTKIARRKRIVRQWLWQLPIVNFGSRSPRSSSRSWESECRHRIDIPLSGSSLDIASGSFWARILDLRLDLSFSDSVLTMCMYICKYIVHYAIFFENSLKARHRFFSA